MQDPKRRADLRFPTAPLLDALHLIQRAAEAGHLRAGESDARDLAALFSDIATTAGAVIAQALEKSAPPNPGHRQAQPPTPGARPPKATTEAEAPTEGAQPHAPQDTKAAAGQEPRVRGYGARRASGWSQPPRPPDPAAPAQRTAPKSASDAEATGAPAFSWPKHRAWRTASPPGA